MIILRNKWDIHVLKINLFQSIYFNLSKLINLNFMTAMYHTKTSYIYDKTKNERKCTNNT